MFSQDCPQNDFSPYLTEKVSVEPEMPGNTPPQDQWKLEQHQKRIDAHCSGEQVIEVHGHTEECGDPSE
jgi:hypothetical protein